MSPRKPDLHPDYPFAAPKQDKTGKWRWRFTKGARKMIKGDPWNDPEGIFHEHYMALVEGREPSFIVAKLTGKAELVKLPTAAQPKTLRAAWHLYRKSDEFEALELKVQKSRASFIENKILGVSIEAGGTILWGDAKVSEIEREHVNQLFKAVRKGEGKQVERRTKAGAIRKQGGVKRGDGRGQERVLLGLLRHLFRTAVDAGWLKVGAIDPLHGLKKPQPDHGGHRTWTDEQMAQYEARWDIGTPQRVAYALALWLGNRVSDIQQLKWSMLSTEKVMIDGKVGTVRGFRFTVWKNSRRAAQQGHTPTELFLPITPMLARELAPVMPKPGERPRRTFVVPVEGNFDRGYASQDSLQQAFTRWCIEAGVGVEERKAGGKGTRGYTCHGLRKALAVKLVKAGVTTHELMQWFGWKNIAFAELYAREIQQSLIALNAGVKLTEYERQAGGFLKLIEGGKS